MSNQIIVDAYPEDSDGFELDAYIRGLDRTYNEHRIRYRPMYSMDRTSFVAIQNDEARVTAAFFKILAARIVSWDVKDFDKNGQVVGEMPITENAMKRLNPKLLNKIAGIVVWGNGGDIDPKSSAEDLTKDSDARFEAAIRGTSISDAKVDAQQKN